MCINRFKNSCSRERFPFPETNLGFSKKIHGVRKGEIIVITSGSGRGKTYV